MRLTNEHIELLKNESGISQKVMTEAYLESIDGYDKYFNQEVKGIRFPYYDLDGKVKDYRLKFTPSPKENLRYLQVAGEHPNCYFTKSDLGKLLDSKLPLIITEGEKKLLSFKSNCIGPIANSPIISYPGCWNWVEKDTNGKKAKGLWNDIPLENREVILIPDTDFFSNPNVYKAIISLITFLTQERKAKLKLIDLRLDSNEKIGVDDFILKLSFTELIKRIKSPFWSFTPLQNFTFSCRDEYLKTLVLYKTKAQSETRKEILEKVSKEIGFNLKRELIPTYRSFIAKWNNEFQFHLKTMKVYRNPMTDPIPKTVEQIRDILIHHNDFYRNKRLNSLIYVDPISRNCLHVHTAKDIVHLLNNHIIYREYSIDTEGNENLKPIASIPEKIISTFLSRSENFEGIKEINYSSHFPLFKNGLLQDREGYNPNSKLYYLGKKIQASKESSSKLHQFIDSFPLEEEADKINLIGFMISFFFIPDFIGEKPAIIVRGDGTNLGKTTLVQCLAKLFTGKPEGVSSLDICNEDELKKQLCSYLAKQNIIFFDNIKKKISSTYLERLITERNYSERILGKNETFERSNDFIIAFTINNGSFSEDITARSVVISMHSSQKEKLDFKSFDVHEFVLKNRNQIIWELSELVKSFYLVNDEIKYESPAKGFKFEKWANFIGKILTVNGWNTFLTNQDSISNQSNPFLLEIEALLNKGNLRLATKYTSTEIVEKFSDKSIFDSEVNDHQRATRLGKLLSQYQQSSFGQERQYFVCRFSNKKSNKYAFKTQKLFEDDGGSEGILSLSQESKIEQDKNLNIVSNESNPSYPIQT